MLSKFLSDQPDFCKEVNSSVVVNNKISHAYLIESKGYEKVKELVLDFAKLLICPDKKKCFNCNICDLIDHNIYPNLKIIEPDGMWIKKEQLENLKYEFNTKSIDGLPMVYIIFQADKLNKMSANSILKFLEEPEDGIIAILVTDNRYNMLNTIISRCQLITLKNNLSIEFTNFTNFEEYLNFIMDYERNNKKLIAYINDTFNIKNKNRDDYYQLLVFMEEFYNIVLQYKVGKKIDENDFFYSDISYVSSLNSIDQLIRKLDVIENQKQRIKFNVNLSLLLDKFIIDLSGGVDYD